VLDVETALAAGQHEGGLDDDLAPVVDREAAAAPGDAPRRRIPETQAVGEGAKSVHPTLATAPVPPGSTTTRRVLLPFTLEMLSWVGVLLRQQQQFPLIGGQFRGRGPISSNSGVKSWG